MAETNSAPVNRDQVRAQERAVWSDVERVGRELRANPERQVVSQAEQDAAVKPRESFGG